MTGNGAGDWTVVDEGWGRKAVGFATFSEPGNCREYVAMHHLLGEGSGAPPPDAIGEVFPVLRPGGRAGPAYEAIQHVGEQAFLEAAADGTRAQLREGLPLHARSAWSAISATSHDRTPPADQMRPHA